MNQPYIKIEGYDQPFPITEVMWIDGIIRRITVDFGSGMQMYRRHLHEDLFDNAHGNLTGKILTDEKI